MKKKKLTEDERIVYLCAIDFQHHLDSGPGHDIAGIKVYNKLKDLKREHPTWKECGIVRMRMTLEAWVKNQKV